MSLVRFHASARWGTLALFLLVLGAAESRAQAVDPTRSTIGSVVVGTMSSGAPWHDEPTKTFVVTLRDVEGSPLAGRTVELRFVATEPRLCTSQSAATLLSCPQRRIWRSTGTDGRASFQPRMGGWADGAAVEVWADGSVLLGAAPVRSLDIDALGAETGLGDFSIFSSAFIAGQAVAHLDFDLSGGPPSLGDFDILVEEYLNTVDDLFFPEYCP